MEKRRVGLARFPAVYQINTRIFLNEAGRKLGRPATFDDLSDPLLDDIAQRGFNFVWMLGVWQVGARARTVFLQAPDKLAELAVALPDLREQDVVSSPFAISAYQVNSDFGGDAALAKLRQRLAGRGIGLFLDFVANHVALDHRWVYERPELMIGGSAEDLRREPQNYVRVATKGGPRVLAHGRDPHFDGWPDTIQLNYRHAGLREAQLAVLGQIAERCDGIHCDMAMLLEPEVIARTWGDRALPGDGSPPKDDPFWTEATSAIRRRYPAFKFIAEVYWDLEWTLQQRGFDFTYDKRLYDRLRDGPARSVREHLQAEPAFSERCLRFLENHDQPRAAASFELARHRAAAVIAFFVPGMRLIHEGQVEGRRVQVPMQLGRRSVEPVDEALRSFYLRLFAALAHPEVHAGSWRLETCRPAWAGNPTADQFIASSWELEGRRLLAVSNYGPAQAQCYVEIGLSGLPGKHWRLIDLMSDVQYQREGTALAEEGLYLDLPPWGHHVFALEPLR
jgi:glycosidase